MTKVRPRGPGGQFIRRQNRISAWMGTGEVVIIFVSAIVYATILLAPIWVSYLRGD